MKGNWWFSCFAKDTVLRDFVKFDFTRRVWRVKFHTEHCSCASQLCIWRSWQVCMKFTEANESIETVCVSESTIFSTWIVNFLTPRILRITSRVTEFYLCKILRGLHGYRWTLIIVNSKALKCNLLHLVLVVMRLCCNLFCLLVEYLG